MGKSIPARSDDPASGAGGAGSPEAVSKEEEWLKSWAFATSPHGLGLSSKQSWRLTPREFAALVDQHPHALAMRQHRAAELQREKAERDKADVNAANAYIQLLRKDGQGKLKAPPGWEWAEKLKEEQHG
jgi:hypothetical protein